MKVVLKNVVSGLTQEGTLLHDVGHNEALHPRLINSMGSFWSGCRGEIISQGHKLQALYTFETEANEADHKIRELHLQWMKAHNSKPNDALGHACDPKTGMVYIFQTKPD